jgi:hypothetical protein
MVRSGLVPDERHQEPTLAHPRGARERAAHEKQIHIKIIYENTHNNPGRHCDSILVHPFVRCRDPFGEPLAGFRR